MVVLSVGLETPQETIDQIRNEAGPEPNHFLQTAALTPVATSIPGIYGCGVVSGTQGYSPVGHGGQRRRLRRRPAILRRSATPWSRRKSVAQATTGGRRTAPDRGLCLRLRHQYRRRGPGPGGGRICQEPCPMWNMWKKTCLPVPRTPRTRSKEVIRDNRLNRIVVAACTPRTHEPLFQETLVECGSE